MIELPESIVLARQLNETVAGKTISLVMANQNPHKFAWFHDGPENYGGRLRDKKILAARAFGGKVEIAAEDEMRITYTEGINLRYIENEGSIPQKHQLLLGFDDGTYLCASVQMYGGMWAFKEGEMQNEYYLAALAAVPFTSDGFNLE